MAEYQKGGVKGRRNKVSGGDKLVQAKYHFRASLKKAIADAATDRGMSASNFLNSKLMEDPDIKPFLEHNRFI